MLNIALCAAVLGEITNPSIWQQDELAHPKALTCLCNQREVSEKTAHLFRMQSPLPVVLLRSFQNEIFLAWL